MPQRLVTPIETLAAALHHAALQGLPDVEQPIIDYKSSHSWTPEERTAARDREARGEQVFPRKMLLRRPATSECTVLDMFPQSWGSTSLGFGGLGGAAVTSAYTVVIEGPTGHQAVYWDGRLAYVIDPSTQTESQQQAWRQDRANRATANLAEAPSRYAAVPDDRKRAREVA